MGKKDPDNTVAILLNAYLDGELSSSQRQKVERLLAQDPQVRELLAQLEQVAQSVAQLPRTPAPTELCEAVERQLERDILLEAPPSQIKTASRVRLQRRRFAVAAVLLVGIVSTIIYTVLSGPSWIEKEPRPHERLPVAARPSKSSPATDGADKDISSAYATAEPERRAPGVTAPVTRGITVAESPVVLADAAEKSSRNLLQLLVTSYEQRFDAAQLEGLLARHQIKPKKIEPDQLDAWGSHYALTCSARQLRNVFNDIKMRPDLRADLILVDEATDRQLFLPDASEYETITIATAATAAEQFAYALRFNLARQPADTGGESVATTTDTNEVNVDLLDWFADAIAKGQPQLPHLRTLGKVELAEPCPQCPAETLQRHTRELTQSIRMLLIFEHRATMKKEALGPISANEPAGADLGVTHSDEPNTY